MGYYERRIAANAPGFCGAVLLACLIAIGPWMAGNAIAVVRKARRDAQAEVQRRIGLAMQRLRETPWADPRHAAPAM